MDREIDNRYGQRDTQQIWIERQTIDMDRDRQQIDNQTIDMDRQIDNRYGQRDR